MLILVSYDLPDDRRRTKLAALMEDFGRRVHYSVFECDLDAQRRELLRRRVTRLIEPTEDSVRLYRVCGACRSESEILGTGTISEPPSVYIV